MLVEYGKVLGTSKVAEVLDYNNLILARLPCVEGVTGSLNLRPLPKKSRQSKMAGCAKVDRLAASYIPMRFDYWVAGLRKEPFAF